MSDPLSQLTPFQHFQALCGLVESFGVSMNWIQPSAAAGGRAAPQERPAQQPAVQETAPPAVPETARQKPGRKPKGYYATEGDAGNETIVESVAEMLIPDPDPEPAVAFDAAPETVPARKKPGRKPKARVQEEAAA